jgi:hypothetical protein
MSKRSCLACIELKLKSSIVRDLQTTQDCNSSRQAYDWEILRGRRPMGREGALSTDRAAIREA